MACFFDHKLVESDRYFAPPVTRGIKTNAITEETVLKLAYGITTIVQRCEKCGALIKTEVLGDAR